MAPPGLYAEPFYRGRREAIHYLSQAILWR